MNIVRTRLSGSQLCALSLRLSNRANEPYVYREDLVYSDHNFGGPVDIWADTPLHRVRTDFGDVNGFGEASAIRVIWTDKNGALIRASRDGSSWDVVYLGVPKPVLEADYLFRLIGVAKEGCCESVLLEDEQAIANLAEKFLRLDLEVGDRYKLYAFLNSMGFGYNLASGGVVYRMWYLKRRA